MKERMKPRRNEVKVEFHRKAEKLVQSLRAREEDAEGGGGGGEGCPTLDSEGSTGWPCFLPAAESKGLEAPLVLQYTENYVGWD